MRIVVLGARGMLGHMACRVLAEQHDVFGTTRSHVLPDTPLGRFLPDDRWVEGVDAHDLDSVDAALAKTGADAVLNCIGVVKQAPAASDPIESIGVNSLFPHRLAELCSTRGIRMIHFSTDCVFSGERGGYTEGDTPDPIDLYGRSKLLGETEEGEALTLRTSVVGRELEDHWSFFEWVIGNRGRKIRGFDRAIYSGLTTMALSRVIEEVLVDHPDLTGTWHVASEPVSKYWIIRELDARLDLGLKIERDTSFVVDRSLDGSEFAARTGIAIPPWAAMLDAFAADQSTYEGLSGR